MELRCENGIKFGEVVGDANGIIEVKCRSSRCGHRSGVVVLHRFSLETGNLLNTRLFRDITSRKDGGKSNDSHSLRSA